MMSENGTRRREASLLLVIVATLSGAVASHLRSAPPGLDAMIPTAGGVGPPSRVPPAVTPSVPTVPLRWLHYQSDVSPDPGVAFLNNQHGFMLTGRSASPSIDHFLSAAGGATWPGDGVALTRSGGRRWSKALSVPTGIWGLDALSATPDVFAVGVTALYETSDDGTSWQRRGEPAGGPLVEVSFSSPSNGVGLTTLGRLVATSDGGRSWRRVASAGRLQLTSTCASGGGSYLVSDATGTIWSLSRSARLNRFFIPKLPSSVRPSNELGASMQDSVGAPVSYLACSSLLDAEEVTWPVGSDSGNGFGGTQSMVFAASSTRGAWRSAPDASSASRSWSVGSDTVTTAAYGGLAVASSTAAASVTFDNGSGAVLVHSSSGGVSLFGRRSSITDLPATSFPVALDSSVLGISLLPGGRGWLALVTVLRGMPVRDEVDLYATADGGSSWARLFRSARRADATPVS